MSSGGDGRDEERIDGGKGPVLEGVVKGEAEEVDISAVQKSRAGSSTSEQAGGRTKLGLGGEVEDSGNNSDISADSS